VMIHHVNFSSRTNSRIRKTTVRMIIRNYLPYA
jgi:hypothetical protein